MEKQGFFENFSFFLWQRGPKHLYIGTFSPAQDPFLPKPITLFIVKNEKNLNNLAFAARNSLDLDVQSQ